MGQQHWVEQYEVASTTSDAVYKVSLAEAGHWACACPAWKFAKAPKPDCKHIKKVLEMRASGIKVVAQKPKTVTVLTTSIVQAAVAASKPKEETLYISAVLQSSRRVRFEEE